ncbi:MAG: class F sortase, partial [Patescibacteria group bacterium]
MTSKNPSKRLLLSVGIFLFSSFTIFLLILTPLFWTSPAKSGPPVSSESPPGDESKELAKDTVLSEQTSSGLPIRLKIPRIKVDAAVESVGRTPEGAMAILESLDDVAWFRFGSRPGEVGNAVIAGHYGWRNGKTAVFDKLYKLSKGDEISVEDKHGVVTTFVVREIRKYDPEADASDVFESNNGTAHLNLITCAGEWNEATQTFSKRLVVFADKKSEISSI